MKNKQNHSAALGDRFIPTEVCSSAFQVESQLPQIQNSKSGYEELLEKNILSSLDNNHKIMSFGKGVNNNKQALKKQYQKNITKTNSDKKQRKVSRKPYKLLDAPNLQDDFYLNLLDWSDNNQIAVALDSSLYVWLGCSSQVAKVYETSHINDYICSVAFCDDNKLAIGNSMGQIKVFDIGKRKKVNNFDGHSGRVGSLNWCSGLLASGSRDGSVATWDLRHGMTNKYRAHSQEICGLKWSPEGNYIASGGNDNKLVVHSAKKGAELVRFHEHRAAVKAIGWCPSSPSVLASGGGTADRHIRFFSTTSLKQNYSVDTGSQVCNLAFSRISNEMVTTHGYSLNQINLWNTNENWQNRSIEKVATLTGHTYRVLYLAVSPSGESILTGAGDETLRFWNVFDSSHYKKEERLKFTVDLR